MGAATSRQADTSSAEDAKGCERPQSPKEKHNSADSQAPLARHAATFATPRQSSVNRRRSVASTDSRTLRRASAVNTQDEIQLAPRQSSFELPSISLSSVSPVGIGVDSLDGHSNVTRPPPPPRLHQLSELIDPAELPIDSHIRLPSGTILALEQFLVHPERPRSMRERQEAIQERVRAASRRGVETRRSEEGLAEKTGQARKSDEAERKKKGGRRSCCSCFASS